MCSRACHAGWPTAPSGICIVGIPAWPKCNARHAKFSYSGNLRGTSTGRILLTTNWIGLTARLPTLRFGVLLHEYRGSSNLRNVSTRLSNLTQNIPGDINFQITSDCKGKSFLLKICFNLTYSITLYTPDGPFLSILPIMFIYAFLISHIRATRFIIPCSNVWVLNVLWFTD